VPLYTSLVSFMASCQTRNSRKDDDDGMCHLQPSFYTPWFVAVCDI